MGLRKGGKDGDCLDVRPICKIEIDEWMGEQMIGTVIGQYSKDDDETSLKYEGCEKGDDLVRHETQDRD